MANRIERKFQELKKQRRKAFVAFLTAGDPNLATTLKAAQILEKAGVDLIELGMPFSDPMADGPTIQKSSERALKAGTTLSKIFQTVKKFRQKSQTPILLMGYFNPVFHRGVEKFFRDAKSAGVDGVLLVDLPPEEGEEVRRTAKKNGISLIYLLAPTSDARRIDRVTAKGSGFIYYVSLTGVTGAALKSKQRTEATLKKILKKSRLPVCVGFGIKTPEQAKKVARWAQGVVVGSALVELFAKNRPPKALKGLSRLAGSLSRAVHGQ